MNFIRIPLLMKQICGCVIYTHMQLRDSKSLNLEVELIEYLVVEKWGKLKWS